MESRRKPSFEESMHPKLVVQILVSLEVQLNALPPSGNSWGSHQKQNIGQCLFLDKREVISSYRDNITFKQLSEEDNELYLRIISLIKKITINYSCFA